MTAQAVRAAFTSTLPTKGHNAVPQDLPRGQLNFVTCVLEPTRVPGDRRCLMKVVRRDRRGRGDHEGAGHEACRHHPRKTSSVTGRVSRSSITHVVVSVRRQNASHDCLGFDGGENSRRCEASSHLAIGPSSTFVAAKPHQTYRDRTERCRASPLMWPEVPGPTSSMALSGVAGRMGRTREAILSADRVTPLALPRMA